MALFQRQNKGPGSASVRDSSRGVAVIGVARRSRGRVLVDSMPSQHRPPFTLSAPRQALLVFVVALAVRLAYTLWWHSDLGWPDFYNGGEFARIASNLAEGRGFSSPFSAGDRPTAWFGPVGPGLLSLLFYLHGSYSPTVLREFLALNAVVGAAACMIYAALFRELANLTGRPAAVTARWAVGFGFVLAVWPESVELHAWPLYFTLQDLGLAALTWCIVRWLMLGGWRRAVRVGVVGGVASLVNPVPLPLLAYPVLRRWWQSRASGTNVPWGQVALIACSALLVMSPWMVRNRVVLGAWSPVRANFGVELRQGNNPTATLSQTGRSLHPAIVTAERERYDELGEAAHSEWAFDDAIRYMRANPGKTATQVATRVAAFWLPDLFDAPDPPRSFLWRSIFVPAAAVPLVMLLGLFVAGTPLRVPYWSLFAFTLLVLPIPYYLTNVSAWYGYSFKYFLLMWVGLSGLLVTSKRSEPGEPSRARQ